MAAAASPVPVVPLDSRDSTVAIIERKKQSYFFTLTLMLILHRLVYCTTPPLPVLQASFFGFGPTADIEIEFNNEAAHPKALVKREAKAAPEKLLLFSGKQAIEGTVRVILKPGVRLDHTGIKIELFGQIELAYDRGNSHVFTSLVLPLEQQAGALTESKAYPFDFTGVEKAHETYNGVNVRLRYVSRNW